MPKLTLYFPQSFDDPAWAGSSFCLEAPDTDHGHRGPGEWIVGRHPAADITVRPRSVSAHHCALSYSYAANRWAITDLDSKNGTRINGELLSPGDPRPVKIGDRIHLGPNSIHIVEDNQDTIGSDDPTIASTAPLDHRTGEALPIAPAPTQTYATALNTGVLWLISPSTRLGAAVRLLIVGMIAAVVVLVMDGEH